MSHDPARQRNRMKIGVTLPTAGDAADIASYRQIRDFALQAEELGLDSIWVVDHLLFRFPDEPLGGIWEAWSVLSGLAEATRSVEIGTFVACTAFRNPALLAKMAVTVDEISGGRLILGLGAGCHKPEFDAFGFPFDHRASRFEEALQIIVPLLHEGKVDFHGAYYTAHDCVIEPRGPRPVGPPLLIGAGKPRMLRLTARHADMWNACWFGQPTRFVARLADLHRACDEEGRDRATLATTVGLTLLAPGHNEPDPNPDDALFGDPDAVAQGLRAYEALGVTHAICGLGPFTEESMRWLGEVVRRFRETAGSTTG